MKKNNKKYHLYDKETHAWYPVSPDKYQEYDRWCTAIRKKKQYHNECACTQDKWWLCDGMCDWCEFYTPTTVSLDDPLPGGKGTIGNYITDDAPMLEEIVSDLDILHRLIKRLHELDPDADKIIALWSENPNLSDNDVADAIGRPQETFSNRMRKLREEFKDYK
jgi:RNA polymerase, sigma-24 subunit, ECF subfamily